jgi:hypothetical protein
MTLNNILATSIMAHSTSARWCRLAGLSGLFRDEALFAQVNAGFRSVGL